MLLQYRRPFGRLGNPPVKRDPSERTSAESITLAPVVVNPDIVSNIASTHLKPDNQQNGTAPSKAIIIHPEVTMRKPSRRPSCPMLFVLKKIKIDTKMTNNE
jgi:hypothetical protein